MHIESRPPSSSSTLYSRNINNKDIAAVHVLEDIDECLKNMGSIDEPREILLKSTAVCMLKLNGLSWLNYFSEREYEKELRHLESIIKMYDAVKNPKLKFVDDFIKIKIYCDELPNKYDSEVLNRCAEETRASLEENKNIKNKIQEAIQSLDVRGQRNKITIFEYGMKFCFCWLMLAAGTLLLCLFPQSAYRVIGDVFEAGMSRISGKNVDRYNEENKNKSKEERIAELDALFAKYIPPLQEAYLEFVDALSQKQKKQIAAEKSILAQKRLPEWLFFLE